MKPTLNQNLIIALAATIVSICWGANFTAAKFSISHFTSIDATIIRFIMLCALLLPFACRIKPMYWKDALALSILYISLHFVITFHAMAMGLSVSSTIIVLQMGVPFSCILAAIFFKDRLGAWRSFGLLTSFFGLVLIAGTPNVVQEFDGFMMALLGAFLWAAANSYMKVMRPAGVISMLFWPGIYALPQLVLARSLFSNESLITLAKSAPMSAWTGIAYSAVFSSLVGYGIWMWLLSRYDISKVVPYSLTMPAFALLVSQFFFYEPLQIVHYLGIAFTVLGVAIISLRRPSLAEEPKG